MTEGGNHKDTSASNGVRFDPDPRDVRRQVDKILAGRSFARSGQLRRFLAFAVEETLSGNAGRLKEYTIGVEVFERDASYDPRVDPVVRVQARRLRSKLEEYYAKEGSGDTPVIEFAKGGYAPVFSTREAASATHPSPLQAVAGGLAGKTPSFAWSRVAWSMVTVILVAGAGAIVLRSCGAAATRRSASAPVLRQLTSDPGLTTDPALSPDGRLLLHHAGNGRGGIRSVVAWEPSTGRKATVLRTSVDSHFLFGAAFSPDARRVQPTPTVSFGEVPG